MRTAGWATPFTAESRIRFQGSPAIIFQGSPAIIFQGSPAIIARYVAESPALQRIKPGQFSPKRRLLPVAKSWTLSRPKAGMPHRRRYVIPEDSRQFRGDVIADDAIGEVYITVNRS